MITKNVTKLSRHDQLVRDTRPDAFIWSKLDRVYWTAKLNQLKHQSFELGTVSETGMSFTATFKIEGERIKATLTPHSSGHRYTHMTVWRWFALKPKLVGEDKIELEEAKESTIES